MPRGMNRVEMRKSVLARSPNEKHVHELAVIGNQARPASRIVEAFELQNLFLAVGANRRGDRLGFVEAIGPVIEIDTVPPGSAAEQQRGQSRRGQNHREAWTPFGSRSFVRGKRAFARG